MDQTFSVIEEESAYLPWLQQSVGPQHIGAVCWLMAFALAACQMQQGSCSVGQEDSMVMAHWGALFLGKFQCGLSDREVDGQHSVVTVLE